MIDVNGLKKYFGATRAIDDISFVASDGAITGLLGANGAGKTTTLRIISGLLEPDGGTVRIDDNNSQRSHLHHAALGTLLDHTGLYSRLTAVENLAYFGELHGFSASMARSRAVEVLDSLGLRSVADQRVMGFSLGQRTKVALGRAIIHAPGNLVLDEPTNGLDVLTVRALRTLLRKMRDAGRCIVFSSHVLEEVEALCDTVIILANGVVVGGGSPSEIRRNTKTTSLEDAFLRLTERQENEYV
jgi:sodium transport system ATP-binding protein